MQYSHAVDLNGLARFWECDCLIVRGQCGKFYIYDEGIARLPKAYDDVKSAVHAAYVFMNSTLP